MLKILRIAPIQAKHLRKDAPLFWAAHETGMQRPVKIAPFGKARSLDRADGVNDAPRPDRQPRAPQGPREMRDVAGKLWVFRQVKWRVFRHGPLCWLQA